MCFHKGCSDGWSEISSCAWSTWFRKAAVDHTYMQIEGEVQIACSVELAWLQMNTTFVVRRSLTGNQDHLRRSQLRSKPRRGYHSSPRWNRSCNLNMPASMAYGFTIRASVQYSNNPNELAVTSAGGIGNFRFCDIVNSNSKKQDVYYKNQTV